MEHSTAEPVRGFARTLAFLALSFALAFCLQVAVHETGHLLAGMLMGGTGGRVILHPFYTSRVVFTQDPSTAAGMAVTGLAGPALDLLLALPLALLAFRRKGAISFPLLAWGSIALFGEGFGMLSSLAMFQGPDGGRYYEDVTQLFRLGVPAAPIWAVASGLGAAGVAMMAIIAPRAGLGRAAGFPRRLAAFSVFLPLWFLAAVLWIQVLSPSHDNLETRMGQAMVATLVALALACFFPLALRLSERLGLRIEEVSPSRRDLLLVAAAATVSFAGLILL